MASRSRRQHAKARRDCRMGLTFTGDEIGRVRAAARRNGMAPAAWAAKAALDRADGRDAGPVGGGIGPEVLAAVRKLNATGRLAVHAARCMDAIDRASDAIEELRPPRHW